MLLLFMSIYWGSMLPLFMSLCMLGGANVASVHVHMYVLGREGGWSLLPLFISMCICYGRVNVAPVHVHVLGVSMLALFMFICWESQCCPCARPCVRTINVAYVHVNVYVIGGHCRLCPYQCVCLYGWSMLPPFLSMC